MAKHRPGRLAETLKEEISALIRLEMKDPRLGFVSITRVDVSGDLAHAKVHVSVLGKEDERKATLEVLNGAAGFVRTEIGKRIRLRHVPEIVFSYDSSIEHGANIARLLKDVGVSGSSEGGSEINSESSSESSPESSTERSPESNQDNYPESSPDSKDDSHE